jgi:hypothetical protein
VKYGNGFFIVRVTSARGSYIVANVVGETPRTTAPSKFGVEVSSPVVSLSNNNPDGNKVSSMNENIFGLITE